MNETKKWIIASFMVITLIVLVYLSNGLNSPQLDSKEDSQIDISTPVLLSEASDEMPPSSIHQYGISEYQILSDIVAQGAIIPQYKRTFKNTARFDCDIESAYSDFASDMEEYRVNLKRDITELRAMNPKLAESKYEQKKALEKVERLYTLVADYPNHTSRVKDTVKYLTECEYALRRVNNQLKLPSE